MEINWEVLNEAATKGVLTELQAEQLWQFLSEKQKDSPGFHFTHILYYLGGLIAIGAMSLFMNLGWERFGGWGLLGIALVYAVIGLWLTEYFFKDRRLQIPAGIMATLVVVLTPLAIYGLQSGLGLWPKGHVYRDYYTHLDWRWVLMELGTVATGAVMLWRYRFPFLVMPVAVTLWYMSMDLTPLLFGDADPNWELRRLVSILFGLLLCLSAFWVDIRSRYEKDYAFWLYIFGVLSFCIGLSVQDFNSELSKFGYLCINLAMIVVGAVLSRRVFVVFGGFGTAAYFSYQAYGVFKNSMMFPFLLTGIGFSIIYIGIVWQRHEAKISSKLRGFLPASVRRLIERRSNLA